MIRMSFETLLGSHNVSPFLWPHSKNNSNRKRVCDVKQEVIEQTYNIAKEQYAAIGVDTEAAWMIRRGSRIR